VALVHPAAWPQRRKKNLSKASHDRTLGLVSGAAGAASFFFECPRVWGAGEAAAAAEAEGGCLCPASICHRERESCAHLGRCRIIAHLFSRIKLILPDTPAPSRDRILFCYVEDQRLPLVTTTLCSLPASLEVYANRLLQGRHRQRHVQSGRRVDGYSHPTRPCGRFEMCPYSQPPSKVPLERGTAAAALSRPIPTTCGPPFLVRRVRAALL